MGNSQKTVQEGRGIRRVILIKMCNVMGPLPMRSLRFIKFIKCNGDCEMG